MYVLMRWVNWILFSLCLLLYLFKRKGQIGMTFDLLFLLNFCYFNLINHWISLHDFLTQNIRNPLFSFFKVIGSAELRFFDRILFMICVHFIRRTSVAVTFFCTMNFFNLSHFDQFVNVSAIFSIVNGHRWLILCWTRNGIILQQSTATKKKKCFHCN